MRNALCILSIGGLVLFTSGCVSLTPELVAALAEDEASTCISTDIRGGAGGIVGGATGGYGQGTLRLCRSNKDNAKITMGADGSISIQNGGAE